MHTTQVIILNALNTHDHYANTSNDNSNSAVMNTKRQSLPKQPTVMKTLQNRAGT